MAIRLNFRYYEHYYAKVPVFDEHTILAGLNPQLHSEIVTAVLRDSVGKLPLFDKLPPDFKISIFPHLKPLSFNPGASIFKKGSASKDLFFLVDGEVLVLDEMDNKTPRRRILTTKEVILNEQAASSDEAEASVPSQGCFGQSVLLGRRRAATHVAYTHCECMIVSKVDLVELFDSSPFSAKRMCDSVLKEQHAQDQLRSLGSRLRIGSLPTGNERRSALLIQFAWMRFNERRASRDDDLYKLVFATSDKRAMQNKISAVQSAKVSNPVGDEIRSMFTTLLKRMEAIEREVQGMRYAGGTPMPSPRRVSTVSPKPPSGILSPTPSASTSLAVNRL